MNVIPMKQPSERHTVSVTPLNDLPKVKDPFQFKKLSDVVTVPIDWIWKPYIPRGALTLIAGDGGYGKSWLTCALTADLSAGRALPGQDPLPPQRILMVSAEDGISQVIKPKMELLKADMNYIQASDNGFTLDAGAMTHLVRYIQEYDVAVVFFDPLVVYLGGRIDMHKANEARSMLTLLSDVAKNTHTAIVAVHHVRKSGEGALQHKVMGSADFINGVRSGLMVDISKGGQRYMAHAKSNWAANGPTLAYTFGKEGFQWQGEYDGATSEETPEISTTRRGAVEGWLRDSLKHGPVAAMEMLHGAAGEGYSERTVARAKKGLVESYNTNGMWMWKLNDGEIERIQREEIYGDVGAKMPEVSTPEAMLASLAGQQTMEVGTDPLAYARSVLAKKAQPHGE